MEMTPAILFCSHANLSKRTEQCDDCVLFLFMSQGIKGMCVSS